MLITGSMLLIWNDTAIQSISGGNQPTEPSLSEPLWEIENRNFFAGITFARSLKIRTTMQKIWHQESLISFRFRFMDQFFACLASLWLFHCWWKRFMMLQWTKSVFDSGFFIISLSCCSCYEILKNGRLPRLFWAFTWKRLRIILIRREKEKKMLVTHRSEGS